MPVWSTLALGDREENMYYKCVKGHKGNINRPIGSINIDH